MDELSKKYDDEEMPENDMAPLNLSALEQMQTPQAREGMKKAFDASPEELAQAALKHAAKGTKVNPAFNFGATLLAIASTVFFYFVISAVPSLLRRNPKR